MPEPNTMTIKLTLEEAQEMLRTTLASRTNGVLDYSALTVEIVLPQLDPEPSPDAPIA